MISKLNQYAKAFVGGVAAAAAVAIEANAPGLIEDLSAYVTATASGLVGGFLVWLKANTPSVDE